MKGSSVLLQGLAPPVHILPKQRQQLGPAPSSASTFSSRVHSCRILRRHSLHDTRQRQVPCLDNEFHNGVLSLKDFRSSFHGNASALKYAKTWVKNKPKVARDWVSHIRIRKPCAVVQPSSSAFDESHRTRGSYPDFESTTAIQKLSHGPRGSSYLSELESTTAVQAKFLPVSSGVEKDQHFDPPVGLDQSGSVAQKWIGVRLKSLEHRRPSGAEENAYQRAPSPNSHGQPGSRIHPSYMVAQPRDSKSSKAVGVIHTKSKARSAQSDAGLESQHATESHIVRRTPDNGARPRFDSRATQMSSPRRVSGVESDLSGHDRIRSSQNGASPALNSDLTFPASGKQRYGLSVMWKGTVKVSNVNVNQRRVQQTADTFSGQLSVQAMVAEGRIIKEVERLAGRRYESDREGFFGFHGAGGKGDNHVAQLEASISQTHIPGAAKWREATKIIEQNRNSSNRLGAIKGEDTNRLSSNLGRAGDSVAKLTSSPTVTEVPKTHESELLPREEEGQPSAISEGAVNENSIREDPICDEVAKASDACDLQKVHLSNRPDNELQRMNAADLGKVNIASAEALVEQLRGQHKDLIHACDTEAKFPSISKTRPQKANLSDQPDTEQQWMNADVLVVDNIAIAEAVVEQLRGQYKDLIHACDTEVADIDVTKQSPIGHGRMICFSIYCGPKPDFGGGKCRIWVDVLRKPEVLEVFRTYFEDPEIKKVWHNYSFDRHILANHGINAQGFHADTMHLARLYDSARTGAQGGYSLEGLTGDKNLMGDHWGELKLGEEYGGKRSMKHLFGKPNIKKNGEEGKLRVVPPVEELQTQPEWQDKWIHYSSFDTVCTWCLWSSLEQKLRTKKWLFEGKFSQNGKMYDFYEKYLQPFGELLVQMEAEGMMLDREHLAKIEAIAIKQQEFAANQFRKWAAKHCPDAIYMNVGSDAQIRQLLFGGKEHRNDPGKRLEKERIFTTLNTENYIEEGRKVPKKTKPFTLRGIGVDIPVESYTSAGWPAVGGDALKALAGKVSIDYNLLAEEDLSEDMVVDEASGEASAVLTSTGVTGGSEEDLSVYGHAFHAFGGGKAGKEACMALAALCEVGSINTLISNFIQPLQGNDIKGPDGRIHCSLNINTETGRLSARRPSLQNQPALEKDRYKIRQAFVAAPGKSLVVADYGQLELRILAHLTDCKSMLKAFSDGGDFHSRTAMNMYPHVRKAVENGDVNLEWEPKPGEKKPPIPLLKDVFGAERRKAKMLNFSIAYGKTAMGLSKDWKVSLDEAKATVELWYSDRQEVRIWQEQRIREAVDTHHVHTLLGRTRHFPDVKSSNRLIRGHIERAAINTPVQGSAADVAMCAMLEINRNITLQDLGWKLVLQVHDEVILEGPSESAAVAKDVVVKCMGFPFGGKNDLRVALAVDAKFAQSWYAAK